MRIPVLCPSCGTSFTVSDQFAGRKGPCPKCKTPIAVPTLAEIGAAGPSSSGAATASPAAKKVDAPGGGTSSTAGRAPLTPPGKTGPAAGAPAPPGRAGLARAPGAGGGATNPTAPGAANGPANGAASPAKPGAPAKPTTPAKTAKDLSPAAKVAAKLDNRSLIRPAAQGGGAAAPAAPTAPARPSGPQQVGIGTGRQAPITDEVIIHEPDAYQQGGVDKKGRPILKPITRQDAKFRPVQLVLTLVGVLLVFGIDWYLGRVLAGKPLLPVVVWLIIAASSVPLALGGYWVLAPSEAEPYTGPQLWIRVGACAAVYSLLWIARAFIPPDWTQELAYWAMIAPPFFVVGAAAAFLSLDLEGENTLFHFVLFLAASVLLRGVAGLPWV